MKQLLTLILLITTTFSLSQNKIHFGVQVNGNFTTGIPVVSDWPSDNYKGLETFSFCYAGGVTVDFDLTDKLSLQSGFLFRKSGDRSKYEFEDITTNSGFIYPNENPGRQEPYAYKFKYFGTETPLNVYYTLTEKLKIGVGGSVLYNFKAFSQKHYKNPPKPLSTPAFIHEHINFLVNLGVQYNLNKHFFVEAKSQYQLTETFLGYFNTIDVPRNHLSIGLTVGYKFN